MDNLSIDIKKLLFKFSNCACVLEFYGYLPSCEWMMNILCKETKILWKEYKYAFNNLLSSKLKTINYRFQFDQHISSYLLSLEKRYGKINYQLEILLIERNSYLWFLEFLEKLKNPSKVVFKIVKWALSTECVGVLNKVYQKLIELGYSEEVLQTTDDVNMRIRAFNVPTYKIKEKINYLSVLPLHHLWRICDKIGSLKIRNSQTVNTVEKICVPVRELRLDSDKVINEIIFSDYSINPKILESVERIGLKLVDPQESYSESLLHIVQSLINIFSEEGKTRIKEIDLSYVSYTALSLELLETVCKIQEDSVKVPCLRVGNTHSFKPQFKFEDLKFCYASEGEVMYFQCEKAHFEFKYAAKKGLGSNEKYIWFPKASQILFHSLKKISAPSEDFSDFVQSLDTQKSMLILQLRPQNSPKSKYSLKEYIQNPDQTLTPIAYPLCDKLDITLDCSTIQNNFDTLSKIIGSVPKTTKILLSIHDDDLDDMRWHPEIFEVVKQAKHLKIEQLTLIMTKEAIVSMGKEQRKEIRDLILGMDLTRFYYKATRFWSKEPAILNFEYVSIDEDIQDSTNEEDFLFRGIKGKKHENFKRFITTLFEIGSADYERDFYDLLKVS